MPVIEVTQVLNRSSKTEWTLVMCRKRDNILIKCEGVFGCQNFKIVPGQLYRGTLLPPRNSKYPDTMKFKGHPVLRSQHNLKWALKSAGLSYKDSAALFSHMKPFDNLLNAIKKKQHASLMSAPGIGRKKLQMIYAGYSKISKDLNVLQDMGKTFPKLCEVMDQKQKTALLKWFDHKPKILMQYIQSDPWRILYDCEYDAFKFEPNNPRITFIRETTFKSRQKMAAAAIQDLKLLQSDPRAKRVECIHIIKMHMNNTGDYWMPLQKFKSKMGNIQSSWPCIIRDKYVALKKYAQIEKIIEDNLLDLLHDESSERFNGHIEIPKSVQLDEHQRSAVYQAIQNNVFILQGGAGVGKTSVCKWIVHALKKKKQVVNCAAPTGKAAQRLTEVTGVQANTVHRLAYKAALTDNNNDLFRGTLLLDEQSMQEPEVLANLLVNTFYERIIFVGDTAQLTSVGAGQFFKDICASKIPRVELTKIYRSGPTSFVASNGQKIRNGDANLDTSPDSFEVIPYVSDHQLVDTARNIYQESGVMPMVLCNTNEEVSLLNPELRKICNPLGSKSHSDPVNLDYANGSWRYTKWQFGVGDSVINIHNKYKEILDAEGKVIATELEVANGEIGTVSNAAGHNVSVSFYQSGRMNTYKFNVETEDFLRPAYALTVNKSQGSEYATAIVKSRSSWGDREKDSIQQSHAQSKNALCMKWVIQIQSVYARVLLHGKHF